MVRGGRLLACAVLACGLLAAACGALGCSATGPQSPRDGAANGEARYRALVALLAKNPRTGAPVDSVAELLPLLDDDLRSSFTLVYASRSPAVDVDPVHPRVVLFGSDARVVVAVTGDPAGANRDVVELIHFRDEARAFELERFVLPAAARRDPQLAVLARDNGHANPRECLKCHGADPRPIFDSYPVWPGFYGSSQDAFAVDPAELAGYRQFLAAKDAPGSIYRSLEFPPGSEVSPYTLAPAEDQTGRFAPNMRLGMALTERNRERISRMLEGAPQYAAYRARLLAGMLQCAPLPITDADRARVSAVLAAEDAAKLDRANVRDPDTRHMLRMQELKSLGNLAEIDYVARVLDVGRADWSMALEPGSLALYDGILSSKVGEGEHARDFYVLEDFLFELLRTLDGAPFAAKRYAIRRRTGTRLDLPRALAGCSDLAARAAAVALPAPEPALPMVGYRCVRCHEPGGDGPAIPFDSHARLRAALAAQPELAGAIAARTIAHDAGAMPLGQPALSAEERDDLLEYVRELGARRAPDVAPVP